MLLLLLFFFNVLLVVVFIVAAFLYHSLFSHRIYTHSLQSIHSRFTMIKCVRYTIVFACCIENYKLCGWVFVFRHYFPASPSLSYFTVDVFVCLYSSASKATAARCVQFFFVHSFIRCLKSRKKSHRINTHTHSFASISDF